MRNSVTTCLAITILIAGTSMMYGCSAQTSAPSSGPRAETAAPAPPAAKLDAGQTERLKRIMVPLLGAMDRPVPVKQVKIGVLDDPQINAANAGNGEFYVTTGLLQKANDDQLTAVLAHEVAHEDLGHVAKAQRLGAGVGLGMVILDQIIPGSGSLTPIAGALVTRAYSRKEEYAADRHGVELLERTGRSKQLMIDTLTWLLQTAGSDSGGFFATHPATTDRIDALRSARAH